MAALGMGALLAKHWGAGVFSGVAEGCTGTYTRIPWSVVAMGGEGLGPAELVVPTSGVRSVSVRS